MKQDERNQELDRIFHSYGEVTLPDREKEETLNKLLISIDRENKKAEKERFIQRIIPAMLTTILLLFGGWFGFNTLLVTEEELPKTALDSFEVTINELKPTDFYEFRLIAFLSEEPPNQKLTEEREVYEQLTETGLLERLEQFYVFTPDSDYAKIFDVTEFPTFIGLDHKGINFSSTKMEDVMSFMEYVKQQQAMAGPVAIRTIEEFPYDIKQPTIMPFSPTKTTVEGIFHPYGGADYLSIDYQDEEKRMQIFILTNLVERAPEEYQMPLDQYHQVQLSDDRDALYYLSDYTQLLFWDDGELHYTMHMYLTERGVEEYSIEELVEIANSFESKKDNH